MKPLFALRSSLFARDEKAEKPAICWLANSEKRIAKSERRNAPPCICTHSRSSSLHAPARTSSWSRGKETAVHQQLFWLRPRQRSRTPAEVCSRQEARALRLPLPPAAALRWSAGARSRRNHCHHS